MSRDTDLVHGGRDPQQQHGLVNTPVYRGSTVLFPTLDALEQAGRGAAPGLTYARFGTPTQFALADALTQLEGGHGTVLAPSGLMAVTLVLQALLRAGDHVLVVDCVYEPVRHFCDGVLAGWGIEVSYFDPRAGGRVAELLRPNTKLVLLESPGSLTFELQDVPAIAQAAHARGALVACDSTWATPLHCNPLALGADLVVHAATKYILGHADALLGAVVCNEATFARVRSTARALGVHASPDDCFLALRGLRSLSARLARHQATALALADFLAAQPQVAAVIHPALASHPDHALWRRDCRGSCGLFAVRMQSAPREALRALLDGLRLFGLGYSWGGFESLVVPAAPAHLRRIRTATPWPHEGVLLRFHAGLEDPADLVSELRAGLARWQAAC